MAPATDENQISPAQSLTKIQIVVQTSRRGLPPIVR